MKLNILPKDDVFFTLFEEVATCLVDISILLEKAMNDPQKSQDFFKDIQVCGKAGEKKVKELSAHMQKAFITPFDLEDINVLKNLLDSIIDNITSVSEMFVLYNVQETRQPALQLVDELVVSMKILQDSMIYLRKMRIKDFDIEKIKASEKAADRYFKAGIKELFSENNVDVLDVIKWKDIYQELEDTVDFCKLTVTTIEGIVLKHA